MHNLTQDRLASEWLTVHEGRELNLGLDEYAADSLGDMLDSFAVTQPDKRDRLTHQPSAYVHVPGVHVQLASHEPDGSSVGATLLGIRPDQQLPLFYIHDGSYEGLANWCAGNLDDYRESRSLFRFSRGFVEIPEVTLQYTWNDSGHWLTLKGLREDKTEVHEMNGAREGLRQLLRRFRMPKLIPADEHR